MVTPKSPKRAKGFTWASSSAVLEVAAKAYGWSLRIRGLPVVDGGGGAAGAVRLG